MSNVKMRSLLPKLVALTSSLVLAAAAQILAFLLTGGGHGWLAPFPFSLLLWLTYPAVGLLLLGRGTTERSWLRLVDRWLLCSAILADLTLLLINDWTHIPWFWRNYPGFVVGWAVLWIGWQIPPAWIFAKRLAGRGAIGHHGRT
jgi:hypothetical protein